MKQDGSISVFRHYRVNSYLLTPIVAVFFLALTTPTFAEFGGNKLYVDLQVPAPPKVTLAETDLKVTVKSNQPSRYGTAPVGDALRNRVEQGINMAGSGFNAISNDPKIEILCTIDQSSADVRHEYRKMTQRYRSGYKDSKGKDIYSTRTVDVQFIVGNGQLAVSVTAKASGPDVILHSDVFRASKNFEAQDDPNYREDPLADALTNWILRRKKSSGPEIPYRTSEELQQALVDDVANQIVGAFVPTYVTEKAILNLGDGSHSLDPGNALAKAERWQGAIDSWQGATVKNQKEEAGRQYNLSLGYEMLTYKASGPEEAIRLADMASDSLQKARQLDPKEKYFREGAPDSAIPPPMRVSRVEEWARKSLEAKVVRQTTLDSERAMAQAEVSSGAASGSKTLAGSTVSESEEKYRSYIKVRLASNSQDDPVSSLLRDAELYGITHDLAQTIIADEVDKREREAENLARYKKIYADFSADGKVNSDERAILDDLKSRLSLSTKETQEIENTAKPKKPKPKTQ